MSSDNAPKSGEYNEGKLWFTRRGTMVTLGLTNLAVEEIGTVERVEFPNEGEDFSKGEAVMTVYGSTGDFEVLAPATGMIQEMNEATKDDPERVSEDPFEEGWLCKMKIEDPSELIEYVGDSEGEDDDEDEDEEDEEDYDEDESDEDEEAGDESEEEE